MVDSSDTPAIRQKPIFPAVEIAERENPCMSVSREVNTCDLTLTTSSPGGSGLFGRGGGLSPTATTDLMTLPPADDRKRKGREPVDKTNTEYQSEIERLAALSPRTRARLLPLPKVLESTWIWAVSYVKRLLEKGMDAKGGHLKVMDILLEHGANIDARTKGACGWTPLHIAARRRDKEALKFLVENGAFLPPDINDCRFNPPVHYCTGLEWAYEQLKRLGLDSSEGSSSYSSVYNENYPVTIQ